jgi:8-oxo-dGTP pyrophosphatase MutT (NUDIX family)
VATIIESNGKYLMVKEISNGKTVLNQPAGHLDEDETLMNAAIRETLEETGWHVRIDGLVGFYLHTSPHNKTTYFRTLFVATALNHDKERDLDKGILEAPWLTLEEIKEHTKMLRSPMVLQCIEDYQSGKRLPLECISHLPMEAL